MNTNMVRLIVLLVSLMILGGCASTHMTLVPDGQRSSKPAPGKALIYFVRPSSFGGAIQSTIYDGDDYIGTVSANTHVAYQASPGKRMFMVVGESADFMRADLSEGKIYYAQVVARMGLWKARFSLVPSNGQHPQSQLDEWISSTKQVTVNEEGRTWARENAPSIMQKKARDIQVWNNKSDDRKQILLKESGH